MIKPLISCSSLLRIKGVFLSGIACRWRLAALVLALGLFGLPGISTPVDVKTVLADDDGPGGDDDGDDGGGGGFGGGDDDDDDRSNARTSRTQGSKFFSSGGSRNKAVKKNHYEKTCKEACRKEEAQARYRRARPSRLCHRAVAAAGIRDPQRQPARQHRHSRSAHAHSSQHVAGAGQCHREAVGRIHIGR